MSKCIVIAEIGTNWLGDFDLAEKMISAASKAGADFIKTQTWQEKKLKPGPWDEYRNLYKSAQLNTQECHSIMNSLCKKYGIRYLTSLFDPTDIDIISHLNLKHIKIAGIESRNRELLDVCSRNFEHLFVSLCGTSDEERKEIIHILRNMSCDFTVMHGVYVYPCLLEYSNMIKMKDLFALHDRVGYSDHTQGPYASMYAIANEACVVERHFTIDNKLYGKDNKYSCLPEELKEVCDFRDAVEKIKLSTTPNESFVVENFQGRWAS